MQAFSIGEKLDVAKEALTRLLSRGGKRALEEIEALGLERNATISIAALA